MGVVLTDMACGWACGNRVPKGKGRKRLCPECRAFVRRYRAARVHKANCGQGDERYAAVKAERVPVYAMLAELRLPLTWEGNGHATEAA